MQHFFIYSKSSCLHKVQFTLIVPCWIQQGETQCWFSEEGQRKKKEKDKENEYVKLHEV